MQWQFRFIDSKIISLNVAWHLTSYRALTLPILDDTCDWLWGKTRKGIDVFTFRFVWTDGDVKLVVSDDEHDVGDDEVALSEVAEVGEHAGKTLGTWIWLAGPRKLISNYSYYICILLINVISLIYICHTSFWLCLRHRLLASSLPLPSALASACWGHCPQTPFFPTQLSFHCSLYFCYSSNTTWSLSFTKLEMSHFLSQKCAVCIHSLSNLKKHVFAYVAQLAK